MRTKTASRAGMSWALGCLIVLAVPAFAQAQQMGLFPLGGIQRKRTPCANEDPIYRSIRQEYYGYYPTCWRRFPSGWGCPSPEAPDPEAAFRKLKRTTIAPGFEDSGRPRQNPSLDPNDPNSDPAGPIDDPAGARRPGMPAGDNRLPALPNGGDSPFDIKDGVKPKPTTPPPSDNVSPFDIKPNAAPAAKPRLEPPADTTNPKTSSRATDPAGSDAPLLALSEPGTSGTVVAGDLTLPGATDNGSSPVGSTSVGSAANVGTIPPPRRVSLIGGLIDRVRGGLRR